jgi:hypothetical protein
VRQCRVSGIVVFVQPGSYFMSFEERIRELCGQVAASGSEAEAVVLVLQLRSLMHERAEELRRTIPAFRSPTKDA